MMKYGPFFAGVIIAAWFTWLITFNVLEDAWEKEAIENNSAHYDGKTAEFTWNKSNGDK